MFQEHMDITIFKVNMNLLNHIDNKFVYSLYDIQKIERCFLGSISLNISDQSGLCLHLTEEPNSKITKWKEWGTDYNTVVLELILQGLEKFECTNINNLEQLKFHSFVPYDKIFQLIFSDPDSNQLLSIEYRACAFQRARAYLNIKDL